MCQGMVVHERSRLVSRCDLVDVLSAVLWICSSGRTPIAVFLWICSSGQMHIAVFKSLGGIDVPPDLAWSVPIAAFKGLHGIEVPPDLAWLSVYPRLHPVAQW